MKQKQLLFTVASLLLLIYTLQARENPFAPVNRYGGEPLSKPLPAPDFKQEIIPVIKTVKQQAKKPQESNTTQQPKLMQKTIKSAKKKKKPILFTTKKSPVKQAHTYKPVSKKHPTKTKRTLHKQTFHLIYHNDNLKIYTKGKKLKIITRDTIINDFKLKHPNRLVLDFGDDFVLYNTIQKSIRSPYFKMLKIGTHSRFYRITFVLAKNYRYRIKNLTKGYLVILR